jgi:hypothetical protein
MSGPSAAVAVSAAVATVCLVLAASSCSTGSGSDAPGLPPSGGVDYQLGGAYEPSAGTAVVVRDATAEPAPGIYSVCYLNAFQSQPGTEDSWGELLLQDATGAPVADPDWPDEFLLDTSSASRRAEIADRLAPAIRGCADAGFDAAEFDNLDSYLRSGDAGTALTPAGNLALARQLTGVARDAGLASAQKNAPELAEEGKEAGFDFAVTEDCGAYGECAAYTTVYGSVLDIEYADAAEFAGLCRSGDLPEQAVRRDPGLVTPDDPGYAFDRC